MSELLGSILHIDDNEVNRYVVARVLRNAGFAVTEAVTGTQGLSAIAITKPDLVILDIKLPDMSGFEVCHQIKSNPATANLPVLHLSAHFVESRDKAQGLDSGADGYLAQPVEPIELIATVKALLRIRRAENSASSSEERFRLLLDNVKDYAIFFFDPQGLITGWSQGAEYILGYQEAEILGQPASCIFTPEDLQKAADKQEIETAVREGRTEDERWHVRKDGSLFWGSGIVTPLLDDTGKLRGFCKILRDYTERKRIEDERAQLLASEQEARSAAEAANRMKDEFLATLSHELRSPLNAMLGWIRLLNTRKFDEATTVRAMETIERNAKSQAQLVEDILDVSRIIRGKLRLNIRPLDLVTVIEAALETLRPSANAKEIILQLVLDGVAHKVAGDSDRLQQVIWNLLSNAIKFTPQGGCVKVKLEHIDSQVEIIVTDTGQGIHPEFLPYVFDRFSQADSSTKRTYTGLGIGLAIVRHLVELHGGTVHAYSPGVGQGATFTVKLPLIQKGRGVIEEGSRGVGEQGERGENDAVALFSLSGVRVLVVDDHADARDFLVTALEMCDAKVTAVSSVVEAIQVISLQQPHVLVSDIGMPDEDGYDLIRQLRKLPPEQGGNIPALALTAYASNEDRLRCESAGFQMHLPKPVVPTELVSAIKSLVGRGG
ncbi:response regulator [Iningainema tapete]|uniref:Circadian input-output histidine kinase CikA n=1 Tax=Iningainema tapete BLCC-T55 TaxID=2748662 RepID=A0A8J7C589_9CYAN|nr:response regulator [Iningainema tapete]MBD2772754.1 response regulator [Iningainema tapete BLCC-T55]